MSRVSRQNFYKIRALCPVAKDKALFSPHIFQQQGIVNVFDVLLKITPLP